MKIFKILSNFTSFCIWINTLMRLFEDILDDLTAIDSKAKQSAVSDSDKLYEPMDVEQFEVLLRFNVFYDIYLTKA